MLIRFAVPVLVMMAATVAGCAGTTKDTSCSAQRLPDFLRPGAVVVALGDDFGDVKPVFSIELEILQVDGVWAKVRRVDGSRVFRSGLKEEYNSIPYWVNASTITWAELSDVPGSFREERGG